MASLQGLKDGQEGAVSDLLPLSSRRRGDALAKLLAASAQSLKTGSWSGNPSDLTLHAALHTPEIPWGSGLLGTMQTPCAHYRENNGI